MYGNKVAIDYKQLPRWRIGGLVLMNGSYFFFVSNPLDKY